MSDYPDGRLIACHRDPRAWYASASRQKEGYSDLDEALALWRRGAEETLAAKAERGDAVFVVAYEDLVLEPERVTRALARWLDIQWNPILLPTDLQPVANGPQLELPADRLGNQHSVPRPLA